MKLKLERTKLITDEKGIWKRVSVSINNLIAADDAKAPMLDNSQTDMLTESDIVVDNAKAPLVHNAQNDVDAIRHCYDQFSR